MSEIPGGDAGTVGSTLPWMRALVREGRADPLVRQQAEALRRANPGVHPAEAVFRWAQAQPYAYDEEILTKRGYGEEYSELLQGAPLQVGKALLGGPSANIGDCDDRAILVQSLLESQGYPTRFVVVRGPGRPDFSHVYSEVKLEDGRWAPLDTIMDGRDGRPLLGPGEEVGAPVARDRTSIPVEPEDAPAGNILPLALVALALLIWRKR